jgi:hypothetical protein
MRRLGIAAVAVLIGSGTMASRAWAANPSCGSLVGMWHNQLGSTMDVKSVDATTGQLTGTYRSPSGGGATDFPLTGWTNSSAASGSGDHVDAIVGWAVRWGSFGSVTAWNGTCREENGTPTITTLWHLARPNSGFTWDHVLAGSDTFVPGAATEKKEVKEKKDNKQ